MKDTKHILKDNLQIIIKMTESAKLKSEHYLSETRERPDISHEFLTILNLSDDIVEIFTPTIQAAELYGLSKEAVAGAKYPEAVIGNNGLNFTPWFIEKTQNIKINVKRAIRYWEIDPTEFKLIKDAPMTVEEYIIDGLMAGLYHVERYANTVLDMINQD